MSRRHDHARSTAIAAPSIDGGMAGVVCTVDDNRTCVAPFIGRIAPTFHRQAIVNLPDGTCIEFLSLMDEGDP